MEPVSEALGELLARTAGRRDGRVADYIPELARADPEDYGIAVVSVLGRSYAAGDAEKAFTIQSVSKPFVYALALSELGLEEAARYVGFEPSGEPFNAISLEADTGRPANPMINAGAIVASAMVPGRFEQILHGLSGFAGRELEVDERVYASEIETSDRNRALAHLMRAADVLPGTVEDAVRVYTRQCAVRVTATDIATMSATLANAGVNPRTGIRVLSEDVALVAMSVMSTCGMYDGSGEWSVRVGLPAKSGVGGGIAAVKPGQFGIGVYSPRLDERGNSVRGMSALEALSRELHMHMLANPSVPHSPIVRTRADGTVELRGEIDFIAAEQIAHHVRSMDARAIRLDLTAVTLVGIGAARLLAALGRDLAEHGVALDLIDPSGVANP